MTANGVLITNVCHACGRGGAKAYRLQTTWHNTEDFILKMLNKHVKNVVVFSHRLVSCSFAELVENNEIC